MTELLSHIKQEAQKKDSFADLLLQAKHHKTGSFPPLMSPERLFAPAQHMTLEWSGLTVIRGRIVPRMACF